MKKFKECVPLAWGGEEFEGVKAAERPALVFFGPDKKEICRSTQLAKPEEAVKAVDGIEATRVAREQDVQLEDFKKSFAKPDDGEKLKAIDAMGKSKNPKTAPFLSSLLAHAQFKVRSAAARALGELKDAGAIPALGEVLKNKKEMPEVQADAAAALGAIGDPKAVPLLAENLMTVKDDKPYFGRIEALGKIRDRASVEALISLLGQIKGKPIKETTNLCVKLLAALTHEKHTDAKAWQAWWGKAKETFQVPKE
ncbi:MAG: HEAT repeat domain-containing protein [Planctomycetes bacterium]|nr:HEAT repeat domain-containing protein [Planctomycetota bacterium]